MNNLQCEAPNGVYTTDEGFICLQKIAGAEGRFRYEVCDNSGKAVRWGMPNIAYFDGETPRSIDNW